MARLKNFLSIVFLIIAVVCFLIFISRNSSVIDVDLFVMQFSGLSIAFWMLTSLLLGVFIGLLVSWPAEVFWKVFNRSKDRSLKKANTELARIKSNTAKGA